MNAYDELPYDAFALPYTRPDQLAISAWRAGGPLPPARGYRLLDVGCASGANALALAFYDRSSAIFGIDASRAQIASAQQAAATIGLENIHFEHADLRELADPESDAAEPFDYILAHGLLSWVSEDARAALLRLIQRRLAPGGVAFVSFNAHPGWKLRGLMREWALSRFGELQDLRPRAEATRELARSTLELVGEEAPHPYSRQLACELRLLANASLADISHDWLEEVNHAFYYHEVEALVREHGLHYVAEVDFDSGERFALAQQRGALEAKGFEGVDLEQSLDLLCNRQLRGAILCHPDAVGAKPRDPSVLEGMRLSTILRCANAEDRAWSPEVVFEGPGASEVTFSEPLASAAIWHLSHEPHQATAFEELVAAARSSVAGLGGAATEVALRASLTAQVFPLVEEGWLDLRRVDPEIADLVTPQLHALARHELSHSRGLATAYHTLLWLDDVARCVAELADGSRDLPAIAAGLVERAARGELSLEADGPDGDRIDLTADPPAAVESVLLNLARLGLLEAAPRK